MRRRRRWTVGRTARNLGLLTSLSLAGGTFWNALPVEGTRLIRQEMARRGVTGFRVDGLSNPKGWGSLWGLGPSHLDVRFGTSRAMVGGQYRIDARVGGSWARGGHLTEGRMDVRVRDGAPRKRYP